ncbi:MAG TPA: ABC transporter substrate-binding protein [Candidatus Limnocylindrales bacterium]|jgi:ABC-type transport system substrate-binding protein|nr:ABC transporter substrate-binding protein [Candidatus Limnocylindrales bacterium]
MTRASSLPLRLAALLGSAALIAVACGGGTPSASAPASQPAASEPAASPSTSAEAYDGMAYPADADAPCGVAPYEGTIKRITAVDRLTVRFDLCAPDPAFLPKVAFSVFGIHDSDYLTAHAADKSLLEKPNGTGPYMLDSWDKGNRLVLKSNPDYWGDKALTPNLEFRWSDEAAQRLLELQSGNVDGIDNPGADDIATIQADSSLKFNPREGMNTMYLGFNNTIKPWDNENVRKGIALGINRQELVDNFYPEGSEVASHFTPCSVPFGCEGDAWYDFDATQGKQLLTDAGFDFSKSYKLQFRAAVRGYLPDPPVIATQIQQQLKNNLGINVTLDLQESGAFLDANAAGTLDGIFILGWGADYPDPTNFLDYHFGSGSGKKFGAPLPDIAAALTKGATSLDEATRKAAYTEANTLIKQHVPAVIVAHGASGTAFKADVENSHSSPLSTEIFSVMKAGDRDTLVWMQNAEPLSLYCADETDGESLRACEQINEALYGYEIGGTKAVPALATECAPNDDASVWTCTLRDGVKFHDGADLDANDVVVSYAAQWDTKHPLHVGRSGAFEYFPGLWGGYLNPPAS